MSQYPEHDKLVESKLEAQAIGHFLEWLQGKGIALCIWDDMRQEYLREGSTIEQLLAWYYGIDLNRLAAEKDHMLEEIRKFPLT